MELPGNFDGRHFTTYTEQVKTLRRLGRDDAAAALLLCLVSAVEAEVDAKGPRWPVAPWYYEQLAVIYRKAKQLDDEIAVLQRYVDAHAGSEEHPFEHLTLKLDKAKARVRSEQF